jgi:hypothetical protein
MFWKRPGLFVLDAVESLIMGILAESATPPLSAEAGESHHGGEV